MDVTPDKFYYVALPRLRMPDLPRLPHPRMPALPFSAVVVRGGRRLHSGRTAVEAWSVAHSLDAVLWTLALALAVGVGFGVSRL
jgi:hypothetical protein